MRQERRRKRKRHDMARWVHNFVRRRRDQPAEKLNVFDTPRARWLDRGYVFDWSAQPYSRPVR